MSNQNKAFLEELQAKIRIAQQEMQNELPKKRLEEAAMRHTKTAEQQEMEKYGFVVAKDETKATHVFLDDKVTPHDITDGSLPIGVIWRVITNYEDFVAYLEKGNLPSYISFDYDLAAKDKKTGIDCFYALVAYCKEHKLNMPACVTHAKLITAKQKLEQAFDAHC